MLWRLTVSGVVITTRTFRIVTGVALGSLCVIIFTGALVRLTGSGLGCVDWPACNESQFIDVSSGHTFIEQANRLFTGFVSVSVILAVLTAHRARPRRVDLIALAWFLVVGVLMQVVIGGVVVLTGLNPYANMAHFLVSMILIALALLLYRRAGVARPIQWFRSFPQDVVNFVRLLCLMSVVAVVTGTVVTATGPHAGGEDAVRFGFELVNVARIHGISVIVSIALLVFLLWKLRARPEAEEQRESLVVLGFVAVAQAIVGYSQYLTGVPVFLVGVHIIGATAFFLAVCNVAYAPRDKDHVHIGDSAY
jgi:cytochrome c oxidase assembly protein subunit 15